MARLLGGALDAGLNVIDTAECYEDSESLIGARAGLPAGRVPPLDQVRPPARLRPRGLARASLLSSIERSLERLRTDRLDLIQLHSCELSDLRKGEAIAALERARERGWTRYIGYSGDGEAARYAVECGRFDTLQTSVSIADQEAIERTLPLAVKRGMGVIAKRPIANAAWRHARRPSEPYYQPYWERLRALEYHVPARRGARGVHRAALHPRRSGGAHRDRRHQAAGAVAGERAPAPGGAAPRRGDRPDPRALARDRQALVDRRDLTPPTRPGSA